MKETLKLKLGKVTLEGDFTLPANPKGLILFVHGRENGRFSPRCQFVSQYLNKRGYVTILLNLYAQRDPELNPQEFNLEILANRLREFTVKLKSISNLAKLPFGFYGANTGAAVALKAAYSLKKQIHAVVSKGGRTDLTKDVLNLIRTPTLLLVGEKDPPIKNLNKASLSHIDAPAALKIIPNASHLFEETGALESVALETEAWFETHLRKPGRDKKVNHFNNRAMIKERKENRINNPNRRMESNSKKKVGVWIDHNQALLVTCNNHRATLYDKVESPIESNVRYNGETNSKTRFGGNYAPSNNENKIHNIEQEQVKKYFSILEDRLDGYDEILLLGPGVFKKQFLKQISSNKQFSHVKAYAVDADKMTHHQLLAFVNDHFS